MYSKTIVIVGGGSTWTPGILKSLIKYGKDFPLKKVILYDINEKRQETIGKFSEILFSEEYPECELIYTTDKKVAYTGVDYVFCQIRTGGYEMREKDEKIPIQFGVIGQETCGPGGFAYGLRSIKDMIEMVQDVRSYSRDAWILNYTNPAAIVAYALKKAFPDDEKIINICDQPVNLLRSYGRLISKNISQWEPVYFGLNHFGWFTKIFDEKGVDVVPEIKEKILSDGFLPVDAEQRDASWLDTYAMVKDMLIDFPDYLPNTYLQYYLYPDEKFKKLNPDRTRANEVVEGREKRVFSECLRVIEHNSAKDSNIVHNDAHGDMIVEVALSIHQNRNQNFVLILENNGSVENLPNDAMVEVCAKLGKNGPRAYQVGKIGAFYKGLIENQYAYERLTCEAYFENSYQKALQALTLNRTVNNAKNARKILDALIIENKTYFPYLK